ncbi:MAG: YicC family protein [Acidobacteria bacterium]|nr:YicC family protein [Acidobacteriota bacterium]MBI3427524.1 YicC family protein [Acidobacteriota bacterium]
MLKSMTGYGKGTVTGENFTVTVDMRSVNNRNLDIHWRAPQDLAPLEIPLKKQVQAVLARGRVDVNVSFQQTGDTTFELNRPLIRGYLEAMRLMRDEFGLSGEPDLAALARLPNVLIAPTSNTLNDTVLQGIEAALTQALTALVAMRAVEGHELQKELLSRVDRIEKNVTIIEANAGSIADFYREKLQKRLSEVLEKAVVDEARLAQEVAYLAERCDISEEIARLNSHLVQLRELISGDGEIGKKLDFLLQETNREANTILSKASELEICDAAIDIKTEVEKLREQANNVE